MNFYLQLLVVHKNVYKMGRNKFKFVFFSKPKGWIENTMRLENANHSSATSHCPAP